MEVFMRHIQFDPEDTIADICGDQVFKAAFTADCPASRGALKALVSACIGRDLEVLTVIANEPPALDLRDRQIRYDIRVKFDRGELADVEMTLHPGLFESLRFEYYTARLNAAQEVQGRRGYGKLVPVWQINFVSGSRLFADGWLFHHFEYYDKERKISLGGRTHILVVELGKAEKLAGQPVERLSAVERWALFFRYAADESRRELVNEIMEKEAGIAMAGEMVLTVTQDEIEQAQRETALKIQLDWESYMAEAWDVGEAAGLAKGKAEGLAQGKAQGLTEGKTQGLAQGKAEGKTQGLAEGKAQGLTEGTAQGWQKRDDEARQEKLEAARKMKADGFSPEQIQKYTGLSPEDI
jgi:predicted transposase/invertase (TIGR01784 family)